MNIINISIKSNTIDLFLPPFSYIIIIMILLIHDIITRREILPVYNNKYSILNVYHVLCIHKMSKSVIIEFIH